MLKWGVTRDAFPFKKDIHLSPPGRAANAIRQGFAGIGGDYRMQPENYLNFIKRLAMKLFLSLYLGLLLLGSGARAQNRSYTGSTPAGQVARHFLGIPAADSIDFIRWALNFNDTTYQLHCNYGVGKPNTNGFINGGSFARLQGNVRRDGNQVHFLNGTRILKVIELNREPLHLLADNNSLLVGNGGWSYTLNAVHPIQAGSLASKVTPLQFKDSIAFEGRTPCSIPGVVKEGEACYKLKWHLIFYANDATSRHGKFKITGTAFRGGAATGNWIFKPGNNSIPLYHLTGEAGSMQLYLVNTSDKTLMFADASGRLLVGDEDFSYTLNHRTR